MRLALVFHDAENFAVLGFFCSLSRAGMLKKLVSGKIKKLTDKKKHKPLCAVTEPE